MARQAALLFGLCAALLAAGALPAQAQSPVSTVKDNQGNDLMQIFDNGNLELFQNGNLTLPGTVESTGGGFVLPDGTLLDKSSDLGQLALPFDASGSTSNINVSLFELTQTGTSIAGSFSITNSSNIRPALTASSNGSGPAVRGFQDGTGSAGFFWLSNQSSGASALRAQSNGSGAAVKGFQDGTGRAGFFQISNTSSSATALRAETNGTGPALRTAGNIVAGSGDIVASSGDVVLSDGTTLSGSGDLGSFSLPFSGSASSSNPVFEVENTGGGHGLRVANAGDDGLRVDGAGSDGVEVRSANRGFYANGVGGKGVLVSNAGDDGVAVAGAGNNGLFVTNSSNNGVVVDNATNNGIILDNPGNSGVVVDNPVNNGVIVSGTGNNGVTVSGSGSVAGQFVGSRSGSDESIVQIDQNGSGDGLSVTGAGSDAIRVDNTAFGLWVQSSTTAGLLINSERDGIVAEGDTDENGTGLAGDFIGDVDIGGSLTKSSGSFKIDHPQDPTGKYLKHSFVESPDRMNVYNGNVTLDANGEATVQLPDYFQALNRDFRYQLTAIGAAAPRLHVAERIRGTTFRIAGGKPGMTVSWQVTGIREDAYARNNPFEVEVEKPPEKQGTYRHPEAHGAPKSQGEEALEQRREKRSPDREEQ